VSNLVSHPTRRTQIGDVLYQGAKNIWTQKGVTRDWKKLHKEEFYNFYSSLSNIRAIKSRMMMWAGHVARVEELRNAYRILVGKSVGKRPLGKQWCRTEEHMFCGNTVG
jgi:hypothetical protein